MSNLDPRFRDYIKPIGLGVSSDLDRGLAILGYPSDLGVSANGGRPGARLGPNHIRDFLYKLTPHPIYGGPQFIWDFGDAQVELSSLEVTDQRSVTFTQTVVSQLAQYKSLQILPVCLGGGHEFGYASLKPFLDTVESLTDCIVINLDAHLDARPYNGTPHSGTPFYRLVNEIPNFGQRFLEIGIQPSSCSRAHYDWLKQRGVEILFADNFLQGLSSWLDHQSQSLSHGTKKLKCYLSIDIDVFAASLAPGCSAPQPQGIQIHDFDKIIELLLSKAHIEWLGIFEVAPPLDGVDHRTSRLAALLIHKIFTEQLCQRYRQSQS